MTTLGTTSNGVIKAIRKSFADLSVPNILKTGGGLQYTSREFKEFLQKYGVKHIVSSPHNPQSNGLAESSVKPMKHLIQKTTEPGQSIDNEKFQQALLCIPVLRGGISTVIYDTSNTYITFSLFFEQCDFRHFSQHQNN